MRYLFGDYCLDTQQYELYLGSIFIPLRPKVYQILAYLVSHYDRVVLKQELLEHVWPDQAVGDAALNRQYAYQALDLARQHSQRVNEVYALQQLGIVHAHANPP